MINAHMFECSIALVYSFHIFPLSFQRFFFRCIFTLVVELHLYTGRLQVIWNDLSFNDCLSIVKHHQRQILGRILELHLSSMLSHLCFCLLVISCVPKQQIWMIFIAWSYANWQGYFYISLYSLVRDYLSYQEHFILL